MSFPTATITQGSGLTINTLPNAGQAAMANSLGVASATDQSAVPVIPLSSAAITNPAAVLTRPAGAVSSAVTATNASPCVFTWTGNPLVNGQSIILGGTAAPAGFTAGKPYFVVGASGNNFNLSLTFGGAAINSTSTGTSVTATLVYVPNALIADNAAAGSVGSHSFAIATSAGGVVLSRIRVLTNATSGWAGANLSVNLWSAPPAYTNGDAGPYAAIGAANWLANFLVNLTQFNDGAAGAGGLTAASEMALKLSSGALVYADLQALSQQAPFAGQTFTVIPELLN